LKLPRLTPGAIEDAEDAARYFTAISSALGNSFADAFEATLEQIRSSPRRFARLETNTTQREVRRAILRKFKYLVIYEVERDLPRVLP